MTEQPSHRIWTVPRKAWGWARRQSLGTQVVAGVLSTIIVAGLSAVIAFAFGEEPVPPGDNTTSASPTPQVGSDTGWFDASGHRKAIPYRDELTPWTDRASFNMLVGTPSYGDERAFFDARLATATAAGSYGDPIRVQPGDRIVFRAYVHNCADPAVDGGPSPRGSMVGARLRATVPNGPRERTVAYAYLMADNAEPDWVADSVLILSDTPVRIVPVEGSARLFRDTSELSLDDALFVDNSGGHDGPAALLGMSEADGVLPADGFGNAAVVQFEADVVGS